MPDNSDRQHRSPPGNETSPRAASSPRHPGPHRPGGPLGLWPYAVSLVAVATALGVAWLLQPVTGLENVDLVFLTAIIAAAVRYGLWPSLVSCLASVLAYNFFFIPPLYTLAIADPANVVTLLVFLLVAVSTSNLAARARAEALTAQRRAEITEALYAFSREIAGIVVLDELLQATADQIGSMLGTRVMLLLPDAEEHLQLRASRPAADRVDDLDIEDAQLAWAMGRPDGRDRDALRVAGRLFLPLRTSHAIVGVVGVSRDRPDEALSAEERRLLEALLAQAAIAIERICLGEERDEARLAAEGERLRSALLTSLSHDLKTPLASITGAVTALRQYGALYDAAARDELAGTIQDEAERLGRFVANLLDMTRLEAGGVVLDRQPVDVGEVVGTALQRTTSVLAEHRVAVDFNSGLPLLDLDVVLFEQVLVNLLDNAAKYAPAGSTVTVEGRPSCGGVVLRIADEGPGLAPGDTERVFEKFYRASKGDRQRAGTGLGLAICRGFVEALGGAIHAANRVGGAGAVFTIVFPKSVATVLREAAPE
jgi:two-component system sensor histidine kinase KdpD